MSKLIQNAIKTHDGKIICSRYTHEFVSHGDYSIDGGLDYMKFSYPEEQKNNFEILSLYDDDPIDVIKKKLIWGTINNKKFKYVKLYECETEHLKNIIKTQKIDNLYNKVILYIIEERKVQLRYKKIMKLKDV